MGGGDQWIEVPGGAGRGSSISVAAVIQLTARVEPMRAEPSRWRPARLLGSLALIALALTVAALGSLALSASARAQGADEVRHAFSSEKTFTATGECAIAEPGQVAVDEASGEIYVLELKKHKIVRLSDSGECLGTHDAGAADAIAVDNSEGQSKGDVYVAVAGEPGGEEATLILKLTPELKLVHSIKRYKGAEGTEEEVSEHGAIIGLAVDPEGDLWVYKSEGYILGLNDVSNEQTHLFKTALETVHDCEVKPGFAAGPDGSYFYVGEERENREGGCEPEANPVLVKVNAKGEPYVEAEHSSEPLLEGEPPFKAQIDNSATTGVALDQASGEVYFDNATAISAYSHTGGFVQRFGQAPEAGALTNATGTTFDAARDEVLVAEGGEIRVYVSTTTKGSPASPESELPDGRAYELVTPPDTRGAEINGITAEYGPVEASESGDAITFTSSGPIVAEPQASAAPEPTPNLSTRGPGGWSTEDLAVPRSQIPIGFQSGKGDDYKVFSSELSEGFLNPDQGVVEPDLLKLSAAAGETTVYRRQLNSGTDCFPVPSFCYQALVNPGNAPRAKAYAGLLKIVATAPDGEHAILKAETSLLSEVGEPEGLYEWSAGTESLALVSVLPAGEAGAVENPQLGELNKSSNSPVNVRNAISADGRRVIWSSGSGGEDRLFMRYTNASSGQPETFRIDTAETGLAQPETPAAYFATANAEGTKIFFTDARRLTSDSTIDEALSEELEGPGDLYECDVIEGSGGKLSCDLHDLTAETSAPDEEAEVQGVIGAGEDGTSVYFVANGALAGHGGHGNCTGKDLIEEEEERAGEHKAQSCNLYVDRYDAETSAWEPPTFIASLSGQDEHDWYINPTGKGGLGAVTARVSPNGTYLAFMSDRRLTGYDNDDAQSGMPDEEVFEYDAASDRITCASCNPGNVRPHGILDTDTVNTGEGLGLLIDQQFNWTYRKGGAWLAADVPGWTPLEDQYSVYQSRYLSDSGRLFFNSVDELVPAAKNGRADVYEFEPNSVGSCVSATGCVSLISSGTATSESAFVDASASGNDVFFLSAQPLVQADKGSAYEIYDARVCSEAEPCIKPAAPPAAPCDSEAECDGSATTQNALPSAPPASTQAGSGNAGTLLVLGEKMTKPVTKPAETRAQKLRNALKACRKDKRLKRRVSCERQARKRYSARVHRGAARHTVRTAGR
jgi:hypothetical protein